MIVYQKYSFSNLFITEKTFRAIAVGHIFLVCGQPGLLAHLKQEGFQTFDDLFDESYDTETDDIVRVEKVIRLLKDLDRLSPKERLEIHRACLPIVEHNYNHFYKGGLTDVLWPELVNMLNGLRK
jgi:hypothetical protein